MKKDEPLSSVSTTKKVDFKTLMMAKSAASVSPPSENSSSKTPVEISSISGTSPTGVVPTAEKQKKKKRVSFRDDQLCQIRIFDWDDSERVRE